MLGTITTECGYMAVRPSLSGMKALLRPFAPRITDELPSRSMLTTNEFDPSRNVLYEFVLTFPPLYVRYNWTGEEMELPLFDPVGKGIAYSKQALDRIRKDTKGRMFITPDWIVDACEASGGGMSILYGREACIMDEDHLMRALPVLGFGTGKLPNGNPIKILSHLGECIGDPEKRWWQPRYPWTMRPIQVISHFDLA